jgi:16S rRNA processing protein RimM
VKDFFSIAKISSLFGRNGFVKVELNSDFPERFNELDKVFVDFWGDKKMLYVDDLKRVGNSFALRFKNFDDEREAGVFIGRDLFVEKDDLIALDESSYFIHDLIGSKVFLGVSEIGEITDVITPPANDVIIVKKNNGKEILIPLVLEFIENFDSEKKMLFLKKEIVYDDED